MDENHSSSAWSSYSRTVFIAFAAIALALVPATPVKLRPAMGPAPSTRRRRPTMSDAPAFGLLLSPISRRLP